MSKPSSGPRHKSRKKFRQKPYFRPAITKFLREFKVGQNVVIVQEPSSQKGMPHKRYKGRGGQVSGTRGKSYIVEIRDGNKAKRIISRAEHLKPV